MRFRLQAIIFLISSSITGLAQSYTVHISVSDSLLQFSEVKLATEDVKLLLRSAGIPEYAADTVFLEFSSEWPFSEKRPPKPYPVLEVDPHPYLWESFRDSEGRLVHKLSSPSPFGLACGLYGLLQEVLGFAFYHPRQTYIPDLSTRWPADENLRLEVWPKFAKKGFHLHTMHPLELAEPLFNPDLPGAPDEVKEYIDWLARNEQNVFDFSLMEGVERKKWIQHAADFTHYAQSRGILTSVDVSLHMIQQKSFQLYRNPPASFRSKRKQIIRNLDWLSQAKWNIINMEFNAAEFLTGNAAKRHSLRKFVLEETEKRGSRLMGRQHVVKETTDWLKSKSDGTQHIPDDSSRGVWAHTVMCYSMTEPHAPVYENENLRHMFEYMKRENEIRETWYYPESAYWITFDNSLPILPLSYLSARLSDIDTAAAYDVEGHITFSSGWELGYWLIDWSIARHSRTVFLNDQRLHESPGAFTYSAPFNQQTGELIDSLIVLHDHFLKEKNLMALMTAHTVTDELPKGLRRKFGPVPSFTYAHLRNRADSRLRDSVTHELIPRLREFARLNDSLTMKLTGESEKELSLILQITSLRALHRAFVLEYLVNVSANKESKANSIAGESLEKAALTRLKADGLMKELIPLFRYPEARLTGRFPRGSSFTAYDFGYLYTAKNLHFWKREEEQARKNRYDFFFMNIWDVFRIIGLAD